MNKILTAVYLTLILAVGTANAALYTTTGTFTLSGSTPYNLSLSSFDSTFGTLTDITMTTVTHITPQVQLINFTNTNQNFTNAQSTTNYSLTAPGQVVTTTASTGLISGIVVAPIYTTSTFSGPVVDQAQTIHLASSLWNQYQGTGSLSLTAALGPFSSSATFTPNTLGVGGNGLATGDVTIAYTYTPTPIPAAAWLLGSGLMGLVGIRRSKGNAYGITGS